jgi:predicted esterase
LTLQARPVAEAATVAADAGIVPIPGWGRPALLAVPHGDQVGRTLPLVVALHGAGGEPARTLSHMLPFVDALRMAVLAPASLNGSWDVWGAGARLEIASLDRALAAAFGVVAVDPERVGVLGFSDGASCALAIGLANGDLFRRVVAYSPGFVDPAPRSERRPDVLISQGLHDPFFAPDRCGRRIAASLSSGGYEVTYREFDGGHEVTPAIRDEAQSWLTSN